jgi:hypothetical protein
MFESNNLFTGHYIMLAIHMRSSLYILTPVNFVKQTSYMNWYATYPEIPLKWILLRSSTKPPGGNTS